MRMEPLRPARGPGDEHGLMEYWVNNRYQVVLRREVDHEGAAVNMISIRRQDRKPLFDWRDVQLIKNQLLGPDEEMVQLFPAESRLVDTANQYWFYSYRGRRWPFGYQSRSLSEKTQVRLPNHSFSEQRPFSEEHRPADMAEQEERARKALVNFGAKQL